MSGVSSSMRGRKSRIEDDMPCVDMDFEALGVQTDEPGAGNRAI